jgi:membrane protease YdiL (CAAX protease family)
VAEEYLRRTVIEGWWGIFSIFLNWIPVLADLRALRVARRLPAPTGRPRAGFEQPELPADVMAVVGDGAKANAGRRSALATVIVAILLGVVVQVVTAVMTSDANKDIARRFAFANGMILAFYGAVALILTRQLSTRLVEPKALVGSRARAITMGVIWGLGAAAIAIGFNSLIEGRLTSDPVVGAMFYERAWLAAMVLVFALVVAAPFIEEMLFRGLLVESLRSRGQMTAILSGAVAFAFWHLNPAALRYYVLAGFVLGYIYWRFGLTGSITTHAVFNGALGIAAAVALSLGPSSVAHNGLRLELPVGWDVVDEDYVEFLEELDDSEDGPGTVVLAAESVSGAGFAVESVPSADVPRAQGSGDVVPPEGARDVRPVTAAEGTGTRFELTATDGQDLDVVVLIRGPVTWVITLTPNGSTRAAEQFEGMLQTLALPASVG